MYNLLSKIIEATESSLVLIRKDLLGVKDTKFLCCGTEYYFSYLVGQKSLKHQ